MANPSRSAPPRVKTQTTQRLSGFGSVQFFRKLILVLLFVILPLCLLALATLSILFYQMRTDFQDQIDYLNSKISAMQLISPEKDPVQPPEMDPALALTTDTSLGQPGYQSHESQEPSESIRLDMDPLKREIQEQAPAPRPAKTAYLTFDDGPSPRTTEILAILEQYQVKATFFVTNPALQDYPDIARDLVARGHAIGIHSASHQYDEIYQSVDRFWQDVAENSRQIEQTTGVVPQILRFPGGSVNAYNQDIAADLIESLTAAGLSYFDWNCASGDATSSLVAKSRILENVRQSRQGKNDLVILFHDSTGKRTTVKALPEVIADLQSDGYVFAPLTKDSTPVRFAKIPSK